MSERIVSSPIPLDEHCRVANRSFASSLWTALRTNGDKLAMVEQETGRRATYAELLAEVTQVARRLLSVGCQPQDVIAIMSTNSIAWIVVYLAITRIAAIPAAVNPLLTPGEVQHQLKTCNAKFLFTTKQLVSTALDATRQLKTIKVLLSGASHPECIDLNAGATCPVNGSRIELPPLPSLESLPGQGPDDPATIFFSSGTTGVQKAILLSNLNMQHSFISYCHPKISGISRTRILSYATFSHGMGFVPALYGIIMGARNFILCRFDFETFLRALDENKIESILIVPPLAVMMSKSPLCDKFNLSSLKDMINGSAPLGAEIEELLIKRFPGLVVRQGYGLTETAGACTVTPFEGYGRPPTKRKPGSIGVLTPHATAKIVDIKTGESLGPGQSGELCIKSAQNMIKYINNPQATKETIEANGWLHTGDIGYYDEDGYFYIVDRLKELIKYKGYQVPPVDLEHVLLSHPEVADAGVIGLPDADAGELPLAWVVRKPNSKVTEAEIQQFVSSKVAPFKRLRGGVRFVSAIPRTASGKIMRREMKAAQLKGKL